MFREEPLINIIDITKYQDGEIRFLFKESNDKKYYLDDDLTELQKEKGLDEYIGMINEALTLSIKKHGYDEIKQIDSEGTPIHVDFQYFELTDNNYLFYLRFGRIYEEDENTNAETDDESNYNIETDENDEMIVLMNSSGKYICAGQNYAHEFIYTDKFHYDNSHGESSLLFYQIKHKPLDKDVLLTRALKFIEHIYSRIYDY